MDNIADRVSAVRAKVAAAALSVGRDPAEVTFLAATKVQTVDRIRAAIVAGVDAVGENRVQEMLDKMDAYRGVPLHFIGRLQRNKAKFVVGRVDLIQSIDSLQLAQTVSRLAQERELVQDVLVEVNIGGELSKGGFEPEALREAAIQVARLDAVCLRGLMCIPPYGLPEHEQEILFLRMRDFFVDIRQSICDNTIMGYSTPRSFDTLSMGMSDDFELAVRCGSTLVRVGSAVFGLRPAAAGPAG